MMGFPADLPDRGTPVREHRERRARQIRLALAACIVTGAACGGQAFTIAPSGSEGGAAEGGADVGSSSGSGSGSGGAGDGGGDATAAGDGAGDAGGDAPPDVTLNDAIALPDVVEEAPSHCGGQFACVPGVPAGWEGPFEVYRGSSAPASCSANFFASYQGSGQLKADAATCGCTCGAAGGVQCSEATASFYVSPAGLGTCSSHCTDVALSPGVCASNINAATQCPTLAGTTFFTATASTPSGGSCTPTPSTSLPPPQWGTQVRACISLLAPAQVDCPGGSLCAPVSAQPFDSTLCIAQAGDVQCPASGYTNRSVSYGGLQDGRHCTACTCGAVTGSTCTSTISVTSHGSAASCSGGAVTYQLPQSCAGVQQPGDFLLKATPQAGSCTPSQPTPTGAATPSAPTTFCCQ